jgi:tetratricopeptide (TPR) repeat protein
MLTHNNLFPKKFLFIITGLLLSLTFLETGMRLSGWLFLAGESYRNAKAFRAKGTYRILCLGESTSVWGGRDCYPRQLEKILNQRSSQKKFSVINSGIPATNSTGILSRLESQLNKYQPDILVVMMGINDIPSATISEEATEIPSQPEGAVSNSSIVNFLRSLRTYKLAQLIWRNLKNIKNNSPANGREPQQDLPELSHPMEKDDANNVSKDDLEREEKSLELYNNSANSYFQLAERYRGLGDCESAERLFLKVLTMDPAHEFAYVDLGWCYNFRQEYVKAKQTLEQAVALFPNNEQAHINLGWTYSFNEEYIKAIAEFQKAIAINPGSDWAYVNLGWSYTRRLSCGPAEEAYQKAAEINPTNKRHYQALANCYEMLGDYDSASKFFALMNEKELHFINPITRQNYQGLQDIAGKRNIKLISVQYPMRPVDVLKKMLRAEPGTVFVDNEGIFKEAVKREGYKEYFVDIFGGDFGHFTSKGSRLLAENVARVILKEFF